MLANLIKIFALPLHAIGIYIAALAVDWLFGPMEMRGWAVFVAASVTSYIHVHVLTTDSLKT
jgi:hypothetical protein